MVTSESLNRKDLDTSIEELQNSVRPALTLARLLEQQLAKENASDELTTLNDSIIEKLQALDEHLERLYAEAA